MTFKNSFYTSVKGRDHFLRLKSVYCILRTGRVKATDRKFSYRKNLIEQGFNSLIYTYNPYKEVFHMIFLTLSRIIAKSAVLSFESTFFKMMAHISELLPLPIPNSSRRL